MTDLAGTKTTEITVNTRKLIRNCKSNKKASGAVKELKKFIKKQWKTDLPVYVDESLNKKIWTRGNCGTVGRIRIRVERGACIVNPENKCIRLSLVDVSSFKKLNDCVVDE
ncbi:large subunit ribosomal protein L31e [Pancytospora philotis]|nr:large subunit ribosomal protein L31e [Pancytospora philotis]